MQNSPDSCWISEPKAEVDPSSALLNPVTKSDRLLAGRFAFRRGFPDPLNEDVHYRPQVGVHRITTGPIHSVAEHSSMNRVAENVDGTTKVYVVAYTSDLLGRLEALNQSSPHWDHFFQNSFAD